MASFQDIIDGKVNVTDLTSINYGGERYTGKKAIMALAKSVVKNQSEVNDEPASEPAKSDDKTKDKAAKDQS